MNFYLNFNDFDELSLWKKLSKRIAQNFSFVSFPNIFEAWKYFRTIDHYCRQATSTKWKSINFNPRSKQKLVKNSRRARLFPKNFPLPGNLPLINWFFLVWLLSLLPANGVKFHCLLQKKVSLDECARYAILSNFLIKSLLTNRIGWRVFWRDNVIALD